MLIYIKKKSFIMFTNRETNTVVSPIHDVCKCYELIKGAISEFAKSPSLI